MIEPANPTMIYVPTYNPAVVYGAWPYPAYPPYPYYPYGGAVAAGVFGFAAGVAVGAAWNNGWGRWNWGGGSMNVNVNRNVNINGNRVSHYQTGKWNQGCSQRKCRNPAPLQGVEEEVQQGAGMIFAATPRASCRRQAAAVQAPGRSAPASIGKRRPAGCGRFGQTNRSLRAAGSPAASERRGVPGCGERQECQDEFGPRSCEPPGFPGQGCVAVKVSGGGGPRSERRSAVAEVAVGGGGGGGGGRGEAGGGPQVAVASITGICVH